MPILDPELIAQLLNYQDDAPFADASFIVKYIKLAASFINRNAKTLESALQFENDLNYDEGTFSTMCTQRLPLKFKQNPRLNIYQQYYNVCSPFLKNRHIKPSLDGSYFIYKSHLKFFSPYLSHNDFCRWFFTTTSVAILCIKNAPSDNEFSIFSLEADILLSCGFNLVLIINCRAKPTNLYHILYLLSNHHFTEIHLFIPTPNTSFFHLLFKEFSATNLHGYLNIYTEYNSISSEKAKEFKKNPLIKLFNFSTLDITSIFFRGNTRKPTYKFSYCQTGFDSEYIFVNLSDVPLYDSDNEQDFIPSLFSGFSYGYILSKDFLDSNKFRVKIWYDDHESNDFLIKYINFEDLHTIKIQSYVNHPLYLARTKAETLFSVENLINEITEKINKNQECSQDAKKLYLLFSTPSQKISKILSYVSQCYISCVRKQNPNFFLHAMQIYTAYEACNFFFDQNIKHSGIIYQVETGEGKSCIICLIGALLALMKKTVHISSSNIALSIRDYYESYEFFQVLGLKSAVLLHYNEMPNLNNTKNDLAYNEKFFPKEFFDESLFKNSFNMNFPVCGISNENEFTKTRAHVVFSTFLNFESLYLRMMEHFPSFISKYFKQCSLIVDEADSILIDELTNGTILSRSMKTNANDVLFFIYQNRIANRTAEDVLSLVKKKFPKCKDLSIIDIKNMFAQIDLVNQEEFTNGKKYSIETIIEEEKVTIKSIYHNSKEAVGQAKKAVTKGLKKIFKRKSSSNNQDQNENQYPEDNQYTIEQDLQQCNDQSTQKLRISNPFKKKITTYKEIVPFDYDHKGVLEPNKEFSGYIQQFIAIKEMMNDRSNFDIRIKEVSMNYLYVSHPIFVGLYSRVCGLTGTVGTKFDKKLFMKQYDLITKKIPRNNANLRIDFPIFLCNTINERNQIISEEAIEISRRGNPVLIIFQDLNEIKAVFNILASRGIKNIHIFEGKNETIKPDIIAGKTQSISLGSNVCGRGTDIKNLTMPLHVILTYYTSNARIISQAFGRTARHGHHGSAHIICLRDQFISHMDIVNNEAIYTVLTELNSKNTLLKDYLDGFRRARSWIFAANLKKQTLTVDQIAELRDCKINVNRLKAFNYEFPLGMSYQTFLLIQAQKIFSLFNCPNCKYTWILFQQYLREMILEAWSLFIDHHELLYQEQKSEMPFVDYIQNYMQSFYRNLEIYLPSSNNLGIVETFMHIFRLVRIIFEEKVMKLFPIELSRYLKQNGKRDFCSFTLGFKPFSLMNNSGAKISSMVDDEREFIEDPELKYIRRQPNNVISILSITEKIDGLFNLICKKLNSIIGSYIGLKFFLRRTLGGCEFGLCFDFQIDNLLLNDGDCLIDKDPLLLFTISVKSLTPILAGILIIGLVYIASISKSISEWILAFPVKITRKLAEKTLKTLASLVVDSQIEKLCSVICSFLGKQVFKQIETMKSYDENLAKLLNLLLSFTSPKDFSKSADVVQQVFEGKVKMNFGFADEIVDGLPIHSFLKIGFLLLLCFASFMLNFYFHRRSIKYNDKKVAVQYDDKQNPEMALQQNEKIVKVENIESVDINFKEE